MAEEAAARWPLTGATSSTASATWRPGTTSSWSLTASGHRRAAFEAAEFLMDYLKTRAPFWKREHLADGTTGEWVEAEATTIRRPRAGFDARASAVAGQAASHPGAAKKAAAG